MKKTDSTKQRHRRTSEELAAPNSALLRIGPMARVINLSSRTLDRLADAEIVPVIEIPHRVKDSDTGKTRPAKRPIRLFDVAAVIGALKLQERPAIGTPTSLQRRKKR